MNHALIQLSATHYTSLLNRVKESLKRKKIDGFLVTDIHNVRYLTGFTGSSAFLLITKEEHIFITDFRYKEQAEKEVHGWDFFIQREGMIRVIKNLSRKTGINNLGFESSVSYDVFAALSRDINLEAVKSLVERLRQIKDIHEINSIREAIRRAESAFLEAKPYIRRGARERSLALRLEDRLKKKGCRNLPFDVIVASGPNSAMPHAKPTERKFTDGDLIIIDWGGESDGYFSDMTRTLLIDKGNNISQKKEIYQIVLEANKKATKLVAPGTESQQIDSSARNFIKKSGYGDFFEHGTGHGVGLQVHELPRITRKGRETLKQNMIFTIEPGIYVPGVGGVRIEDMVLVTVDGSEVLTALPKELENIR
jgi:Xaa-Pro aminopeptidase